MTGLKLYTGNRLEALADDLAGTLLHRPLSSPLQSELVVVQSQGMARWLNLELAKRQQIASNIRFPFPKAFAQLVFRSLGVDRADYCLFDPELLQWKVWELLPEFSKNHPELAHYLQGEQSATKQFQLAQKIAGLFDQYLVFRSDRVLEWEEGRETHWQAALWREVARSSTFPHIAGQRARAAQALLRHRGPLPGLPERVSIFGLSSLPPFYVELFSALAGHLEVNFFLLQPTEEYWGDIVSPREEARLLRRHHYTLSREDLHLERGHPLLASWGKVGRDFLHAILDTEPEEAPARFFEPPEDSLLHLLQGDILHLREREEKQIIKPGDRSVQVHSCHTPLREMEVLQDQLLSWLEADPTLQPQDILVMMPEVEDYTPFIQAVFDAPEKGPHRIAFSIADRSARSESQLLDAFLVLLSLPGNRCSVREILTLLECPAVRRRFDLEERELEQIEQWLEKTQIRWGLDEQHRAALGLPALRQHTWAEGLDRLLLGYALGGQKDELFQDKLPLPGVEGSVTAVLGRFADLLQQLRRQLRRLDQPHTLSGWHTVLQEILEAFFLAEANQELEAAFLRTRLAALSQQQLRSDFHGTVGLSILRSHLQQLFREHGFGAGFIVGGVTFCSLKPMRSLPFRVICLVGMNDRAFPRQAATVGFDLLRLHPLIGDPAPRQDDRYLFLEALLSARETFHLSYVGQSSRDNATLPPSVLVSELLSCLEEAYATPGTETMGEHLLTRHRLQAFHSDYFRNSQRHFSFSSDNCQAAGHASSCAAPAPPAPFLPSPLPEPEAAWRDLRLEDLTRFWAQPAQYLLRDRLQLELKKPHEAWADCEPFCLSTLESYQIKQILTQKQLAGARPEETLALLRAQGLLPMGHAGAFAHDALGRIVETFLQELRPLLPATPPPPQSLILELGDFRLTGQIKNLQPQHLLQYRCARLNAKDLITFWITHLAVNCLSPTPGYLLGEDQQHRFKPVTEPRAHLEPFLNYYWKGLCEPIPFFPKSSVAYAEHELGVLKAKKAGTGLDEALKKWLPPTHCDMAGESEDPFFQLCFRHQDNPLDGDFEALTRLLLEPMHAHLEETR